MSLTLAASDRTVIPIYAGIQVYYTSNHEQSDTTNEWKQTREHDPNLMTPLCVWNFSKYKNMKNLARTLFPFWR